MIIAPLLLGLAPAEPFVPFEPFQSTRARAPVESKALSWSFLEAHAQRRSVDAIDEDLTGFGARGGFDLTDGWFLRGGADFYAGDQDLTRFDLGAGHHVEIEKNVQVFASVSWVQARLEDAGAADFDKNGWRAEVGMRSVLDNRLEGEVRVGYEDVAESGLIYGGELRWWWLPNVALGLGYERQVDDGLFTLGLRYAF